MYEIANIVEYRYKKYAKVSGEINFRNDEVTIHKKNANLNIRKQYIKQYMMLLSKKY